MPLPAAAPPFSRETGAAYNPYADPAGLGVRTIGSDTFSGELLEVLRLTPDLGTPAEIEPLIRDRCTTFAPSSLEGLAPVARVERAFDGRLEVWSKLAEGFRLSAVLESARERGTPPALDAALTIGDRLLAALSSLQALEQADGASGHGAIAIDQIVVSEAGALTLTDYALGTTLASLQWPRERLWRRFRIAMPPAAGLARFDHRVDVTQAAVVIAALLAGRAFRAEEYPRALPAVLTEAVQRACAGIDRDERDRLYTWLRSATELESRTAFKSAAVARQALREALGARLDGEKAIGAWLRASRGISEPEAEAAMPALEQAPPAACGPEAPAALAAAPSDETRPREATGLRRLFPWIGRS